MAGPRKSVELDAVASEVLDGLKTQIVILDAEGAVLGANEAARAALGALERGDDFVAHLERSVDEIARARVDGIRHVLGGRAPSFSVDYRSDTPEHERWLLLHVVSRPEQPGRYVVTLDDVTTQHVFERALREREVELVQARAALDRRDRDLVQLTTAASHDLHAPLRAIANLAQWIEEDLGASANTSVREHVRLLKERVARMDAMIDALLQFLRVGQSAAPVAEVDVGSMLAAIVRRLDLPPGLTIEIAPGMPRLRAMRANLQHVFMELLSNAVIHHDKTRGKITIRAHESEDVWSFCVEDDGPGIEPHLHERVFLLFQTGVPGPTRGDQSRTGIGLALVRRLVEDQSGAVKLRSQPGQGLELCFTWRKEAA